MKTLPERITDGQIISLSHSSAEVMQTFIFHERNPYSEDFLGRTTDQLY